MIINNKTQIKNFISKGFVSTSEMWLKKDNIYDFPHFIISNDKWWDGGYDPLCTIDEKRDFYELAYQSLNIIKKFAEVSGETKCCIGPFHTSNNFTDWSNLNAFDAHNALKTVIRDDQYLIIDIFEDVNIMGLVVENNFRYFSQIGIFFKDSNLLIEPTHNCELIVFSLDCEKFREIFSDILANSNWKICDI